MLLSILYWVGFPAVAIERRARLPCDGQNISVRLRCFDKPPAIKTLAD